MSKAQLDKFIGFISNDPSVLQEASKGAQQTDEFIKNVVTYAKEHGYDFSDDEIRGWIREQGEEHADGELSDRQLDTVAGGAMSNAHSRALAAMSKQVRSKSALSATFHSLMRNVIDRWPRR